MGSESKEYWDPFPKSGTYHGSEVPLGAIGSPLPPGATSAVKWVIANATRTIGEMSEEARDGIKRTGDHIRKKFEDNGVDITSPNVYAGLVMSHYTRLETLKGMEERGWEREAADEYFSLVLLYAGLPQDRREQDTG